MKCKEYNTYSILCQGCDYPSDIKCAKRINHGYDILKISNDREITKTLNVNMIQTLDDVKRILEFLDIKITLKEGVINNRYEKVKDLFSK